MIHFLLTPDSSSALKLKRSVAEQGAWTDVVVGAWPELLAQARNSYILPLETTDWPALLAEAVALQKGAFWARSFLTVTTEEQAAIISVIGEHLVMLLEGAGPGGKLQGSERLSSNPRLQRYVKDFEELHAAMGFILPPALGAINAITTLSPDRRLRSMRVYHRAGWPQLNGWQQALIARLAETAPEPEDNGLRSCLEKMISEPAGKQGSSLRFMQDNLFSLPEEQQLDTSLQWLVVRDYLYEVEVAAGMIQQALAGAPGLNYADLALLLPVEPHYSQAVRSIFTAAGIPLAGHRAEYEGRDLGGEAVHNLLLTLQKPAPVIALASLLISPLMPWERGEGNRLAQEVVDLRFSFRAPEGSSPEVREMLALIKESVEKPSELQKRLSRFAALLNQHDSRRSERQRAERLCRDLCSRLDTASSIIWPELLALALPQPVTLSLSPASSREGVAVFYENSEPWRKVERMYVLGCFDTHYPALSKGSSIFTDAECSELCDALQLTLETAEAANRRMRELFRRQIGAVSSEITFLLPSRDAGGKALEPSASLTFAAALFSEMRYGDSFVEVKGAGSLLVNLESNKERQHARSLALAPPAEPQPPRELPKDDLSFTGLNLLEIARHADGTLHSETPTRLDTLMVSPLAWLLERLKAKERAWAPETLNVMTKGTLAHTVFEHLFAAAQPVREKGEIEAVLPALLDAAIQQKCPFLVRSEWKIEREHLRQDILKAALQWAYILKTCHAEILATEISLQGVLDGLPINGNADLLLKLNDRRLLVVDYKKSGSSGRKKRMQSGYDLQAELYGVMIKSGGLQEKRVGVEDEEKRRALEAQLTHFRTAGEIGALYYLMNDRKALANTRGWLENIGGVDEVHPVASRLALEEITARFGRLRSGQVALNSESDKKEFYEQRGLSTFALDNPLVELFMKPGAIPEEASENDSTEPRDE